MDDLVRKMRLAEMLDQALQLLRLKALPFIGLVFFIGTLPGNLYAKLIGMPIGFEAFTQMQRVRELQAHNPALAFGASALQMVGWAITSLCLSVAVHGMVHRQQSDVWALLRGGCAQIPRMLWTGVVLLAVGAVAMLGLVIGVSILFVSLGALAALAGGAEETRALSTVAIVIAFIPILVGTLVVTACLILLPQVIVFEGISGWAVIKRTWILTRGSRWRAVGVMFLVWTMSMVVVAPTSMLSAAIPYLGVLLSSLATAAVGAFAILAYCLLYVDLRCRRDGFDLDILAENVERAAPDGPERPAAI